MKRTVVFHVKRDPINPLKAGLKGAASTRLDGWRCSVSPICIVSNTAELLGLFTAPHAIKMSLNRSTSLEVKRQWVPERVREPMPLPSSADLLICTERLGKSFKPSQWSIVETRPKIACFEIPLRPYAPRIRRRGAQHHGTKREHGLGPKDGAIPRQ